MTNDPTVILANAIMALRPGAQWALRGPTLADLQWLDTAQAAPTQAEIDAQLLVVPVPSEISDRQFFQQLAVTGIVTQTEALAAVKTGALPAQLAALIAALPAADQFNAQMILSGATIFYRNHPLTTLIGANYGWTPAQVDAFFVAAAAL